MVTNCCTVCSGTMSPFAQGTLLGKYQGTYLRCQNCGLGAIDRPHWLSEAYARVWDPDPDTGRVLRNQVAAVLIRKLLQDNKITQGTILDHGASSYQLLGTHLPEFTVRCYDKYVPKLSLLPSPTEDWVATVSLEVLEHIPLEELDEYFHTIFQSPHTFIMTGLLPEGDPPLPKLSGHRTSEGWFYYAQDYGQHVTFFTRAAFQRVAEKYHKTLSYHFVPELNWYLMYFQNKGGIPPETRKKPRVAWLLTHATLVTTEVPILLSLGLEVFVPKIRPDHRRDDLFLHDASLTLPSEVLAELNQVNFYQPLSSHTITLLNTHFDICLCDPLVLEATQLPTHFKRLVLGRAFGLSSEDDRYYTRQTTYTSLNNFLYAPMYQQVIEAEPLSFRAKMVHLPLGLGEIFLKTYGNTWSYDQSEPSIAFVLSELSNPINSQVYEVFVRHFGSLPHKIYGFNQEDVKKNIAPFIKETDEYYQTLRKHRVLFSHNTREKMMRYHPLEAMAMGIPVVFLEKGLLGDHAREIQGVKFPGMCGNWEQSQEVISKVLQGERSLIENIRISQRHLIERWFLPSAYRGVWRSQFLPLVEKNLR